MADSIVVLHVDDEPDFAELAAQFLERADDRLEVITETSADAGLERLDDGADVDCIVSDYDMPKLNGLDFLERVRERDPDRPFILFTGKGSEEVASEALSKGATDYLQKKPGREQYEILANRVLNYVETARTAAQRRRQLDAIESANEGIAILDADGSYIYVNRAYADLYGYEADEMQGQHWTLVYPDDQADWVREQILPEIREEGAWRGELAGLRADDSSFVKDLSVSTTGHGEVICTVRDVTEHRERKQALERYRTIVEAMGDGVYALDAQGKPIHANDVVLDMLGYDYESFLTVDLAELYDPTDIERFEDAIRDLLADEGKRLETVRATVESADGERIPIEVSLTLLPMPDGEFRGTVGVMRDIRDRIDRERELETYRNAFESALSPIAIADADQRLIAVNEAFLDLWGYEDEESVLGRHVSEYWADPAEAASVADEVAATGEWRGQLEAELADGSTKPVECAASVITDEDGELTGLVSAFLDASERATKAAELERYETLLEVVPDTWRASSRTSPASRAGAVTSTTNSSGNTCRRRCRRPPSRPPKTPSPTSSSTRTERQRRSSR